MRTEKERTAYPDYGESMEERLDIMERLTHAVSTDIGSAPETEREIFHHILRQEGFDFWKAVRCYIEFHYG